MKTPTTLIIMDGYGLSPAGPGNAITAANTPVLDKLLAICPHTTLQASGRDVGLPPGQIGNSEVGHLNIGAGRVVYQELPRITAAIEDGSFFANEALLGAMDSCLEKNSALHLFGLLSDGGVHSHNTHLWALLELAQNQGLSKVYIHCFMDGRDVPPDSGLDFIKECKEKCEQIGIGKIATVMGRFYAMDRDNRWDRVESAYSAIVLGEGCMNSDAPDAVSQSYADGLTDEFIKPVVCDPEGTVKKGDSIIFWNFRPDRAREITRAFTDPAFNGFKRKLGFLPLHFVCFTQYDEKMPNVTVAFPPTRLDNCFGEFISRLGLTQLRIAETEKYAHVTFFLNGGEEAPFPGEDRVLIPSPKEYPTYDLIPEMSAYKVAQEAAERIKSGAYEFVVLNFANCDMVGHTGDFNAAVKAVETVDTCVGMVVDATNTMGGICLITSDHGNADQMLSSNLKTPHTAHTTNPVPLIIAGADLSLKSGRLCDIVPTILDMMGLEKPVEMTGESLIT